MRKATWYGHQHMSTFRVYSWYCQEFSGKTFDEILRYQVEPDTVGELAQANALGISMKELRSLKANLSEAKVSAWEANTDHMSEVVINLCMP